MITKNQIRHPFYFYRDEINRIEKLYLDGKLFSHLDEKGANGYWDLAAQISVDTQIDELLKNKKNLNEYGNLKEAVFTDDEIQERIYNALKKLFI